MTARRVVLVALAVGIIVVDLRLISPYVSRAADVLSNPAWGWVAVGLAAEIISVLAMAHLQRRMLRATGTELQMQTVVGQTYAALAMSVSLPAGPAVSAGYTFRRLRQVGASATAASFTLISTGVLSTLAYALLAVAGFVVAGGSSAGPVAAGLGLLSGVLLAMIMRALLMRPAAVERIGLRLLRTLNRVRRREPDAGSAQFSRSARLLTAIRPRRRDWAAGMGAALINWTADLTCLFAACRAVGANGTTIGVVMLAYLGGTSVSGISLVPGGLGIVDAALIVILVRNGVGTATATAAVLLFRMLTLGFNMLVGWSIWLGHAYAVRRAARRSTTPPPHRRTPRSRPAGGIMSTTQNYRRRGRFRPAAARRRRPRRLVPLRTRQSVPAAPVPAAPATSHESVPFAFRLGRPLSPAELAVLRMYAAADIRPLCAVDGTDRALGSATYRARLRHRADPGNRLHG